MQRYSIIDIETTGAVRNGHKITEIAIINLDGDEIVEEYSTLINPERSIPYPITRLTGIDNGMVAKAPKFYEVAKKIIELTEDRIFVAHNVFFDFNFIKNEFGELGFSFRREKLCTVRLARKHMKGHASYSLGKLCDDLGIKIDGRHRAMGDAKATAKLFKKLQIHIDDVDLVHEESSKIMLPPKVSRENFDKIPHKCGVYYFYDEEGELLYVGKSKDIKKRMASHFRSDLKRKKDLALKSSVAHIDYKTFDHELAALLYECSEIKKYYPRFNTALKRLRFPIALELKENKEGLLIIKKTQNDEFHDHFHTFRNKKSADKKLNSLYRSLTGYPADSFEFTKANKLLIEKLGKTNYNKMLKKVFNRYLPKQEDFELKLSQKLKLEVRGRRPWRLLDKQEIIDFDPDQDLFNIFAGYLQKHQLVK